MSGDLLTASPAILAKPITGGVTYHFTGTIHFERAVDADGRRQTVLVAQTSLLAREAIVFEMATTAAFWAEMLNRHGICRSPWRVMPVPKGGER